MNAREKLLLDFERHCQEIAQHTVVEHNENIGEQNTRIKKAQKDYAFFVEYYFPHFAKFKCAKFQIDAANFIKKNPNVRYVARWARGHAKSTHIGVFIPLWLKIQEVKTYHVMVTVSANEDKADQLLSDVQAELQSNKRYIHDFGEQIGFGSWKDGEFSTRDGFSFFALGKGQKPRGLRAREWRPDLIVTDDIDDDEEVQNEARVRKSVDWVLEALFGATDMGSGRFILVGNQIAKNCILSAVASRPGVKVTTVNALDANGEPSWPEKYSKEQIQAAIDFMGFRRAQKEYFNNPITEGAVFKNEWIRWGKMRKLHEYDELVAYCDPSFKSSVKADYKAIKLWGKWGKELHHIAAFVRHATITNMVEWFYDLHEALPPKAVCNYYIESVFFQDMMLDEFEVVGLRRGYQLPIRADKRQKADKFQRVESVSPLWERGLVIYNQAMKNDMDMLLGIDQLLAFEKGSKANDDGPDADEGAIYILQKNTRSNQKNQQIILGHKQEAYW